MKWLSQVLNCSFDDDKEEAANSSLCQVPCVFRNKEHSKRSVVIANFLPFTHVRLGQHCKRHKSVGVTFSKETR